MTKDEERVWRYLLNNRQADARELALNCDVDEEHAQRLINRISSDNWREPVKPSYTQVWPVGEGRKDDHGKPRMDLLPPELLDAVANVLTFGATKYGDRNWEAGMDWGRCYAALMRHMNAWWSGEETDPETGMSHLWHAACCLTFLIAYESRGVGNDDRNKLKGKSDARLAPEKSPDPKVSKSGTDHQHDPYFQTLYRTG